MTERIVLCFLATLIHIPSLILRYLPFREVITKKQKIILFPGYVFALVFSFALYMTVDSLYGTGISFYKMNIFLFCVIMSVFNMLVIKNHLREHLFVFGVVALCILMLFTESIVVCKLIGFDTLRHGLILTSVILLVSFCVVYVLLKKLIISTVSPFLNIDSREYWKYVWFIPIAMFMASFLAYPVNTYLESPRQFISRLLIGGATLFVCRSISSDYGRFLENEILGKQIELQKQYYNELSQTVENDRRARHDFKHHISAIRGFVENKDFEGLSDYISLLEKTTYSKHIPMCRNAALDGILYHYMTLCEENNIKFTTDCEIGNEKITDIDLCVLFGNALSNAFEAAMLCRNERYINIQAKPDGNFLVVTLDNSFDGNVEYKGDAILSRKRKNAEGIGISSMKKVCEKYNGSATFEPHGNVFETGFVLDVGEKS